MKLKMNKQHIEENYYLNINKEILDKIFAETTFEDIKQNIDIKTFEKFNETCGQITPKYYITSEEYKDDYPLDLVCVYDMNNYWYFITYGLSKDYDIELTLKLKKNCYEDEQAEIRNICKKLNEITSITFNTGLVLNNYELIYTSLNYKIDVANRLNISAFISIFETTNNLIKLIGITTEELKKVLDKRITEKELVEKINTDITDYKRDSVI